MEDGLEVERLSNGRWVWVYQSDAGAFHRSGAHYKSKAAAQEAGEAWLERRRDPRKRGR